MNQKARLGLKRLRLGMTENRLEKHTDCREQTCCGQRRKLPGMERDHARGTT
jgi:hypothetical protein